MLMTLTPPPQHQEQAPKSGLAAINAGCIFDSIVCYKCWHMLVQWVIAGSLRGPCCCSRRRVRGVTFHGIGR